MSVARPHPSPEAPSVAPAGDDMRARMQGMWSAVAPSWAEHAAYIDERGAPVAEALVNIADPQPGERVLECACGPGGVGLLAAERVAPGGEVVMSDLVPAMVAIAAERAARLGLANVTTRVLDLERLDEPEASYDVVLCRDGLMLVPDPARAAGEIARVLRPGGRAAVAVWGPRERNPWLGALFDAVSAEVGAPVPPPGPGPFALGDPDRLADLLGDAGWEDVIVTEAPVPARLASIDEWWSRHTALAGPLAERLRSMDAAALGRVRARAADALRRYETGDGLVIPGVTLLAGGVTPSR